MEEQTTIFIPIGLSLIAISSSALIYIYYRLYQERKVYQNGHKYEDEYRDRCNQLRSTIPYYGLIILIGFIAAAFNFTMTSSL
ncbi:MAG: hypothetical protein SNF68_08890 [Rikenellaceae bacterium]